MGKKRKKIRDEKRSQGARAEKSVDVLFEDVMNDEELDDSQETRPDWGSKCCVCGESPIVPVTGLCGPCTFGESDTAGGNW